MVQINSVSSSEPSARNRGTLWGQTLIWLPFVVNWNHTTKGLLKTSRSNMAETVKIYWEIILFSFSFFFSSYVGVTWFILSIPSINSLYFFDDYFLWSILVIKFYILTVFTDSYTPILWPPHAKSWLIGKDPDAGKDWGQEETGTTEDGRVGWHHWLNGHGFGWTPGVSDGQGGLTCCGSWGCKESDMTEWLN